MGMLAFSVLSLPTVAAATVAPKHWGGPKFVGKSVLVTGGDSGIGLAAVEAFYYECARVMIVGHNPTKTQSAWQNLSSTIPAPDCPDDMPGMLAWTVADISNQSQVQTSLSRHSHLILLLQLFRWKR